jgi:hypothetical protein
MSDHKSKLQILLQKSGRDLPTYDYGGKLNYDNTYSYNCTVLAKKLNGSLLGMTSKYFSNKKDAAQHGAELYTMSCTKNLKPDIELMKDY